MRGDTDGPEAEDWFLKAEAFDSAWASTYDVDGLFYGGPRDVTQQEEHGLGNGQSSSFESSALLQPQARETQDGAAPAERPAADADVAAAPPALSSPAATTPDTRSVGRLCFRPPVSVYSLLYPTTCQLNRSFPLLESLRLHRVH